MMPPLRVRNALLAAASLAVAACMGGGTVQTATGDVALPPSGAGMNRSLPATLNGYSDKQRETVNMLVTKYGPPDLVSDQMIGWFNNGPWVRTLVMRTPVQHNFPMPHEDYLTQTVRHRVPAERFDELAAYDGSVWVHRTRGEISAQCDLEPANFLALNLAHDVAMGRRTVQDARAFYARTIMAYKNGDRSSPYTNGLTFQQEPGAADPDQPAPMD